MARAAEMIEASMPELRTWIGRRQVVEDEIALTIVRRIAAMLDLDPARFVSGTELPPHWFSMFFHNNAMQRDIGPDGHPNKGIFLPPIPLPRRMGAGRRVDGYRDHAHCRRDTVRGHPDGEPTAVSVSRLSAGIGKPRSGTAAHILSRDRAPNRDRYRGKRAVGVSRLFR